MRTRKTIKAASDSLATMHKAVDEFRGSGTMFAHMKCDRILKDLRDVDGAVHVVKHVNNLRMVLGGADSDALLPRIEFGSATAAFVRDTRNHMANAIDSMRRLVSYHHERFVREIDDHLAFLSDTLVPDLRESGADATADDFEQCMRIINELKGGAE